MKIRHLFYTLCGSVLLATGCSDKFIDLQPISANTSDKFYKTATDFEQAVNASYDALQANGQYNQSFWMLMEVRSDNTDISDLGGGTSEGPQINEFRELTTNSLIEDAWAGLYNGISRCNAVLDRIDRATFDESLKKQYKGETQFLRALSYFQLVRLFGKVPVVTTEQTPAQAMENKRNEVEEVYALIISDLQAAAANLPASHTNRNIGRATSGSANGVLGKVYLTRKQYADAGNALAKVLNQYQLVPDYASLFDPNNGINPEVIFTVRYKKAQNPIEGSGFVNRFLPRTFYYNGTPLSGSGDNRPTASIQKAYEPNDKRLLASMDTVYLSNATTLQKGRYIKKYLDIPAVPNDAGNSFPVLRYADALLMYAEVLNEQGYVADGDAFTYLNQVRQRAGLPMLTAIQLPNQEAFRAAIFQERRVELAFENQRWFDLIRYEKGLQIINEHLKAENISKVVTADNLLYPVPQREIEVYNDPTKFAQNKGY